jgi:hypothetical protein
MIFKKEWNMNLRAWDDAWSGDRVKELECTSATRFWLCRDLKRSPRINSRWTILCERIIEETGVVEEIIIFSADTEFAARKAFRSLRRVVGYMKCDNDVAIPGLF